MLPKYPCEKTARGEYCQKRSYTRRLRKRRLVDCESKAARGNCVQGADRGEYCHRATVCVCNHCVREGCKSASCHKQLCALVEWLEKGERGANVAEAPVRRGTGATVCEVMTKANAVKGQLLCKKVAKAKVATSNCVQDDWKRRKSECC